MGSSLTTNVDIYVVGDEPERPVVVCHAHVVIEEEAGDEKLLSPRPNDDEMTSSKVAAPNSSVISGSYGGSPSSTLFWTLFFIYNI